MNQEIKQFWNERAEQFGDTLAATTNDVYMRKLEVSAIVEAIGQLPVYENGKMLDVGCGDGYTTLEIARAVPTLSILGIDYSENMIKIARERLQSQPDLRERVTFTVGDVMDLKHVCGGSFYDVALSVRCLINLDSAERQYQAIAEIARHTKPGGYYICVENFTETHNNMNIARRTIGLPEIPVKWHNRFFDERDFTRTVESLFEDVVFKDFASSYYFATRVIYSAMCRMYGEEPDYNHEIHKLAVQLPWAGQFCPTRMVIMRGKLRKLKQNEHIVSSLNPLISLSRG